MPNIARPRATSEQLALGHDLRNEKRHQHGDSEPGDLEPQGAAWNRIVKGWTTMG